MATRPYDHIDVVIFGTIGTTDSWSVTFTCAAVDLSPAPSTVTAAQLASVAGGVMANLDAGVAGSLKQMLSSQGTIEGARCYLRFAHASSATLVGESLDTIAGTGSADGPNQLALVFTTLTGAAGRANRGRAYWPYKVGGVRADTSRMATWSQDMADLLSYLRTGISIVWAAAAGPVVGNEGRLITQVRVDDVLDTQRRRRNKQAPALSIVEDVITP